MSIQNSDHVWSAGGLVFKELASQNDVLVCGFAEPNSWRLPKGRPDGNESPRETALREVNEETGIVTEIVGFIDSIRYSYVDQFTEKRFYKTVYFYLMRPIGGDIAFHDEILKLF